MRMPLLRIVCPIVVLVAALTLQPQAAAALQFAVSGDMPYGATVAEGKTDADMLQERIAPGIRDNDALAFLIHVGDLGRPETACNDGWLDQNKAFWNQEIRKPVFYTPGDNDWTDCDRPAVPNRGSELLRLDAVRRWFFDQPLSLGTEWGYEQQMIFRENATWMRENVLFVTIHVVGTNNGRDEILLDDKDMALALVQARDAANRVWLDRAFDRAQEHGAIAVVVAFQADISQVKHTAACTDQEPEKCDGFIGIRQQLVERAKTFGKPVLLVHGDTAPFCLDQYLKDRGAAKLWRLNAPGDRKVIDAAIVTVDVDDATAPFKVRGLVSGRPAPTTCE